MAIDAAVYERLTGVSGVTDLVGTRVYPKLLPQTVAMPALVTELINVDPIHVSGSTVALRSAEYQVTAYAATYEGVVALADQVRLALSRYAGTLDSTVIQTIMWQDEQDTVEINTDRYGRLGRYVIWYEGAANG